MMAFHFSCCHFSAAIPVRRESPHGCGQSADSDGSSPLWLHCHGMTSNSDGRVFLLPPLHWPRYQTDFAARALFPGLLSSIVRRLRRQRAANLPTKRSRLLVAKTFLGPWSLDPQP